LTPSLSGTSCHGRQESEAGKRTALVSLLVAATLIVAPSASPAATITPTTTADQYNTDPAHCSLREAVRDGDFLD
jgi:CSLREA domain-containing protein